MTAGAATCRAPDAGEPSLSACSPSRCSAPPAAYICGNRQPRRSGWRRQRFTVQARPSRKNFPLCAGGRRVTCVVDGDTFWLDGVKIRLADINAPEVSDPAYAVEAALGWQATRRLQFLLNAGQFELTRGFRDEDRYGRKLRFASRDGRSLSDTRSTKAWRTAGSASSRTGAARPAAPPVGSCSA
jgi:hypothetical protein